MVSLTARERSFKDCNIAWMDPKVFAAAGFFFVTDSYDDCVRCYSCGVDLQFLGQDECLFEEHATGIFLP